MAVILSVFLTGCKKDDEVNLGSFDYDKELIFGTWKITKLSVIDWPYQPTRATFNPDGTYYGRGHFGTGTGTYKLSGKRITTYIEGQVYITYDVVSLSSTTCELNMAAGDESVRITCVKE